MLLRGSLILVDDAGHEHRREDGRFELLTWEPSETSDEAAEAAQDRPGGRQRLRDRRVTAVEVRGGLFEVRMLPLAGRRITHAVLGGHPLFDVQVEELGSQDPAVVELRLTGRALYPARLRVVDRRSSSDLEGVQVVLLAADAPYRHPGDLAPILDGAVSPVVIEAPWVDRRTYLIGARDYAWQRVDWTHLSSADGVVPLERGGALTVDVLTDARLEDIRVTLTAIDAPEPHASIAAARSLPLLVEGIVPGEYWAALVPAASQVRTQATSLARARATVVAGETTAVVLQGLLGERPLEVPLSGSVRMSAAWSAGGPQVVVRALGRTALWHLGTGGFLGGLELEGEGDDWSFRSARAIAGGRYLLSERLTGSTLLIDVGPAGAQGCRLDIPDPIELQVAVVDHETGLPMQGSELIWLPPAPDDASAPSRLQVGATAHPGVFSVRVPAWERLEFEARAAGFRASRSTLRLGQDSNVGLRIALERP
jgi:hypothetical protein